MNTKQKTYVKVTPIIRGQKFCGFESNLTPGCIVAFEGTSAFDTLKQEASILHKPATVISETPFHFRLDFGKYKVNVNKASIYCQDEILYIKS